MLKNIWLFFNQCWFSILPLYDYSSHAFNCQASIISQCNFFFLLSLCMPYIRKLGSFTCCHQDHTNNQLYNVKKIHNKNIEPSYCHTIFSTNLSHSLLDDSGFSVIILSFSLFSQEPCFLYLPFPLLHYLFKLNLLKYSSKYKLFKICWFIKFVF